MFQKKIESVLYDSCLSCVSVEFGDETRSLETTNFSKADGRWQSLDHRRFLVASITKPLVAMAILKLAADGQLSLSERIGSVLPIFAKGAYRRITLRHLLTHTAGLPDMLPNNADLRASQAGLSEFLRQASSVELDFAVGTDCRYSSVGYLVLGGIVEQVSSLPCAEYLAEEFFRPLQMNNTWLGIPAKNKTDLLPSVAQCELPVWQQDAESWDWNSEYWRLLGAPWGGLISTAEDLGRFARMMLHEGAAESGKQILPAKVVAAAIQDQLNPLIQEATYVGSRRPWGFGWRRQWACHHASFGDFVSQDTVGHWGATGTLIWIDKTANRYAVVLTTTPYERSQPFIQRISNIVATN